VQTLLKLGSGKALLNVCTLDGILAYGLSTILYILVLGKLNLSLAYPVVIGLTVITTTIAGSLLLQEEMLNGILPLRLINLCSDSIL
jgi:small multidrug resistance pump